MKKLKKYKRLFRTLFKANLMCEMEYRANFIIAFFLINAWLIISIAFIKSVYSSFPGIGNWTENQALFFIATFNVVDNLFFLLFFDGMISMQDDINSGQYDFILIKPVNGIFFTCFKRIQITRIVNLFSSVLLFLYTISYINFSILKFIQFMVLVVSGVIIYASIFFMINTLSFYIVNSYSAIVIFFDIMEFARLPSTIATGIVRTMLITIFPILFIAGVPCEILFGYSGLNVFLLDLGVTAVAVFIAIEFYKFSVKKYSGASS